MLVKNLEHLKELANNEKGDLEDFYVSLAGGIVKSGKRIFYDKEFDSFSLVNEVDDSFQSFDSSEIGEVTNLLEAISKNALFKDL
ncbi:hypothetical protein ESY86_11835 [Subsaximicrobium wynnwilliamsii]|uniref:Uncharacterized protein n=1 Tax=Subsaximicrobium wynnwilliamsii TaxID=291179 RepID=A0A5C6ZI74_9FLAO|nr:hypothetical protein [Subsaximicrobium wynnwilliamsii]TXD82930.1 hypothetical protein ESY87_11870 [Subsaximicrobium wynnwilliamsii]TXD88651.1 hypothetical protein ESY86_11835 [Subsaximicrobium wynnwilliamsii]TXE02744.1 hypothetical protein ESY88_10890 [Subsaximicrobium wynnwilliamsii]